MEKIFVTRSSLPPFEEYCKEIETLWDSHILTNNGIKHQALEAQLKEYLVTPNIILYTNGHLALESAINALDLKGEVITTPFTFASTTHAIVRNGLTPVFCDINSRDFTIDTNKIEQLITDKTCAIIAVHVYGNVCDVESIEKIAKKHNLRVIYDAAHSFGETKNGIPISNFGDLSMFSFHATKVFQTIEGGAVTFANRSLIERLNASKNFGIVENGEVRFVGGNAKMNEFQASMGICNLRHVDKEIAKRERVVMQYIKRLSGINGISVWKPQANVKHNYSYFPVIFDGYKFSRDEITEKLQKNNVFPRKYFYPPTNSFPCYQKFNQKRTPVCDYISERVLTLPLYADLSIDDVNRICDIILSD